MTSKKYAVYRTQNNAGCAKKADGDSLSLFLQKTPSPAVITPKTSHSPGHPPGHIPLLPFRPPLAATCETAAGHSARIPGVAVLALTAFLFGSL